MLSSIEKLLKFFRLEIERGYDNRAVVGGLDKILPSWENEARSNHIEEETIQSVLSALSTYPDLQPAERADLLNRLIGQLENVPVQPDLAGVEPEANANSETRRPKPERRSPPRPRTDEPGRQPAQPKAAQRGGRGRESTRAFSTDTPGLDASVKVLHGVGDRLSQTLSTLGLNTLEDLLFYFPRRYDDYSQLKSITGWIRRGNHRTGAIQSIFSRRCAVERYR
jgi:ATP-dependent DNA helicase RecG